MSVDAFNWTLFAELWIYSNDCSDFPSLWLNLDWRGSFFFSSEWIRKNRLTNSLSSPLSTGDSGWWSGSISCGDKCKWKFETSPHVHELYLHVDVHDTRGSPLWTSSSLNHRLRCLSTSVIVLLVVFCARGFFNYSIGACSKRILSHQLTFIVVRSIWRHRNFFFLCRVESARWCCHVCCLEWILRRSICRWSWRLWWIARCRFFWIFDFKLWKNVKFREVSWEILTITCKNLKNHRKKEKKFLC